MDDSPPHRVIFDPLPDSPIHFDYNLDDQDYEDPIITPQRKRRRGGRRVRVPKVLIPTSTYPTQDGTMDNNLPLPSVEFQDGEPLFGSELDIQFPPGQVGETNNISLPAEERGINLDNEFSYFVDAVLAEECGIHQLTDRMFVSNGWNVKKRESTRLWYHIQRMDIDGKVSTTCICPGSRNQTAQCYHARFLTGELSDSYIQSRDNFVSEDCDDRTYLFLRNETIVGGCYNNVFSVPSGTRFPTIKNRAVVEHCGEDTGTGIWKCNRDAGASSCPHITSARHSLQQHIQGDWGARDTSISLESTGTIQFDSSLRQVAGIPPSVSYLPLPPPSWARIHSDPPARSRVIFVDPPASIPLCTRGTCCCSDPREIFNPLGPTFQRECTVYTILGAKTCVLTLQKCPKCKQRCIGPECGDIGIFNFNNRSLFSQDLLDDYTSAFSSSETPFVSWVHTVSRRYELRGSEIPFVNEKLFRAAWFSYIRLIQFGGDMICQHCGPTPDVTIWDGVTLAFSRKNLLPSLRPPTTIGNSSVDRPGVRHVTSLQPISNRNIRVLMRALLKGPRLSSIPVGVVDTNSYERNKKTIERISKIPGLVESLTAINIQLGALFDRHFGLNVAMRNQIPADVYQKLFLQLSSDENVLQLIPFPSMADLRIFARHPTKDNVFRLRYILSIHHVVIHELGAGTGLDPNTLGVCKWLYIRAMTCYNLLKVHDGPSNASSGNENITSDDWLKSGCLYGMPEIRQRSKYPSLPHEMGSDPGGVDEEEDVCHKFYSTYSKKRLTGGIMCVWCTHSVCYGFHCIPAAEGRNDVFSAIYTRWKEAPKIIVYDFACALQPYCMTREPEFFKNTRFLIDIFHSSEHKCGEACFLASYCDQNPDLLAVNSSAGECGNSGISKIRKAVSYMAQDRAVMYIRVYFSIWNRQQIRKLENRVVQ